MRQRLQERGALVLVALMVLFLAQCNWFRHPSDSALEKHFYRHEAGFNKLITMSNEDSKFTRITLDFTRPRSDSELGLSKERWDEYRLLFRELGLEYGLTRPKGYKADVLLMVSAWGLATGGDYKGYAYSTKELSPLADTLDEIPPEQIKSLVPVFKKLKGNWYLYYMWDD